MNKNDRKIRNREGLIKWMPACMKYYLLVPILTLVGIIVSCVIPVDGFVQTVFPYLFAGAYLSVATIMSYLIMIPTCFIISRTVNGLKNKNATMSEIKEELQKKLNLSKSKDERSAFEVIQDGVDKLYLNDQKSSLVVCKNGMKKFDKLEIAPQKDVLDDINPELFLKPSNYNLNELKHKQNGSRLVKKLIINDNNKKKED